MTRRWILDTEDVVKDVPDVSSASVPRLPLADIKQHNSRAVMRRQSGLRGEGEAVPTIEVESTHARAQRPGEPVSPELWITGISREQAQPALQPCTLARKSGYLGIEHVGLHELPLGPASRQAQSSGPNVSGMTTGFRRSAATASSDGP